jgi:2,3-bisphosphoglycerate-independent phosphoglycerate mutase
MPNSPNVATYDLAPEMSADQVTKKIIEGLDLDYDLIIANYANPDMVGHSGNMEATIKACEKIDSEIGLIIKKIKNTNAEILIIADHGNCEKMINTVTGEPHTAHTLNLVPVFLVGNRKNIKLKDGRLADIAPTVIDLMNLPKPKEMTGKSLIEKDS